MLLNRCPKRSLISPSEIEQLLGVPIYMTFANDYQGVQRAMTAGRWVDTSSELGRQFTSLAQSMLESKAAPRPEPKKRFIEFFSVVPSKAADAGQENRRVTNADHTAVQNQQGGKTSVLLVASPWRPERFTEAWRSRASRICSRAKCHLAAFIEILFSNPGHLQLQPLASLAESIDERIRLRRYE